MDLVYQSTNLTVLSKVPSSTQKLLDVGCGSGALGKEIKRHSNCQIIGVTFSEEEASLAAQNLDQIIVHDLNTIDLKMLPIFDCIVCSHVLEHLYQPEQLLTQLRQKLIPNGKLIIALPNVLHWKQRLEFLKGNFKYTDGGLMDRTHYRFFDWDTAVELVQSSGFKVISREADGYFPLPILRKVVSPLASYLDRTATQKMPGFFGVQFIIVAETV